MSSINPARYKFSNSRYIHPEYLSVEGCGCENCTENPCQQNFMASFDRDGNILIPAGWIDEQVPFTSCSGYFNNWENEIPPSSVHQIPCYYKVTIDGTENNNVNESWCQQCESLNGEYYAVRYSCSTETGDILIKIPLCNDNNIISYCGLNELEIRLFVNFEIPEQQGHPYGPFLESKVREEDLSKIAPYHNEACYIYRYSQLEEENREKLYIYAVANLKYNDTYQQPLFQLAKPCNCLKYGYFFVTRIGEFKGDYSVLSDPNGTIHSINTFNSLSYGNCIRKYYHGDFDGRNLTFTIYGQDLVQGIHQETETELCNFNEMTITVEPLSDEEIQNHGFNGYPDEYIKNDGIIPYCYDSTPDFPDYGIKGEDWHHGYGWEGIPYYTIENLGLLPQKISTTFNGVISSNPLPLEDAIRSTCNDCEYLNDSHILDLTVPFISVQDKCDYEKQGIRIEGFGIVPYFYIKDLDNPICCNCEGYHSYDDELTEEDPGEMCIGYILLSIIKETQYYSVRIYLLSKRRSTFSPTFFPLAVYEKEIYQKDLLTLDDLNNLELTLIYTNPLFTEVCNFEDSSVTLNLPSPDQFKCLPNECDCAYCAKQTTPEDVLVDIPQDGWSIQSDLCWLQPYGEYILNRVAPCAWNYRDEGVIDTGGFWGQLNWYISMNLSFKYIIGKQNICVYNCLNRYSDQPHTCVEFENVILVYFVLDLNIPTTNRYQLCNFKLTWAKAYPFSQWGTKIQCDPQINWNCYDDPNINPTSTLSGRYIDCAFDQTELSFLFFECNWGGALDYACNNDCIKWNGDSVFITSL